MNSETLMLALFTVTIMGIFSTRFKCFEIENTANPSLRTSPTIYMAVSQRITLVGKDPYLLELSKLHKSVPTRSPRRVEQLYFSARNEPKVRTTGNLERRHTLSLSRNMISTPTIDLLLSCTFFFVFLLSYNGEEDYLGFVFIQLNFSIIPNVFIFFTI